MRVVRKINNNAAICVDSRGRELVALGRGIGFGTLPHEVSLGDITRTFYSVDDKYLDLIGEMPENVLEFAGQLADLCRATLSYELSPNLPITLADHLAFMLERSRKHMVVRMPLAYEVQPAHPTEYKLGELAVRSATKAFGVRIDRHEAIGIALSIANSALSVSERTAERDRQATKLIDQITSIVEKEMGITVDRESFDYARFATHVQYLIDRLRDGKPISSVNTELYDQVRAQYPEAYRCMAKVAAYIGPIVANGELLTQEEKLYLMLHINRISERISAR